MCQKEATPSQCDLRAERKDTWGCTLWFWSDTKHGEMAATELWKNSACYRYDQMNISKH